MKACWTCDAESPGAPFCRACGAVQPPAGEGAFEIFGLPVRYALDADELEKRYRDLHRKLHPDRFARAEPRARRYSLERATSANAAYRVLGDPMKRAEELLGRRGIRFSETEGPKPDPEFLDEVLELRESLEEARAAHDLARVREMAKDVGSRSQAATRVLAEGFDGAGASSDDALAAAFARLKYFRRFMDEVSEIEAQASDAAEAADAAPARG